MLMGTNLYAYLDAGTGSYVIQVIIAFVLGAGFWAKSIIRRIIRKKKDRMHDDS